MTRLEDALMSYAYKFVIDTNSDEYPSDENLRTVLQFCALKPKEEWLHKIREDVLRIRENTATERALIEETR